MSFNVPPADDHEKFRVFKCICGGDCHRPLKGPVKNCDHCDADLTDRSYYLEDYMVYAKEILRKAHGKT